MSPPSTRAWTTASWPGRTVLSSRSGWPVNGERPGQGPPRAPSCGQGRLLGHLRPHRRAVDRHRTDPGRRLLRHVHTAVPLRGRLPQRRPDQPVLLPALPRRASQADSALELHRAHLRRDPPKGQGHRPAPRRALLSRPGVGGARPGQPRLERPHDDPRHRASTPRTTSPAPPSRDRPRGRRQRHRSRHNRRVTSPPGT